jgi:nucleoside-diphosphate-sugar epimerase
MNFARRFATGGFRNNTGNIAKLNNYKMSKKKVLILGGEGFIGRNLAGLLSKDYACFSIGIKKTVFAKRKDKFIESNPYKKKIKNTYDVVIHLIDNKVGLKHFIKEEKKLIKNIGLNKKNHLIIFSSAIIYANPSSEYGQRKLNLEKIYIDYCRKNKINLTIFRLFNIYGPYHLPNVQGSLVANIFCNYLDKKSTIINDINAKRDFIFSKDVAKLVEYSIDNNFYGKTDLATGKMISIKELIKKIEKIIKNKLIIEDKRNKENIFCSLAKNKLIKKIKLTSIEKGLRETMEFYKENHKIYERI